MYFGLSLYLTLSVKRTALSPLSLILSELLLFEVLQKGHFTRCL